MRTPAQAVLWELWRLSRWELLLRIAGMSLFFTAAFQMPLPEFGDTDGTHFLALPLFLLLAGSSLTLGIIFSSFEIKEHGFVFYLGFARPIGTFLLVAVPMVYISVAAGISYLVPAALLRALYDIPFPLLSISAIITTTSSLMLLALWSLDRREIRVLAWIGVFAFFTACNYSWLRYKEISFEEMLVTPGLLLDLFALGIPQYVFLFVCSVGAIGLTLVAVDRQRCGEGVDARIRTVKKPSTELSRWSRSIHGPFSAQFWFEMRRGGLLILSVGLVFAVFTFVGIFVFDRLEPDEGRWMQHWCVALIFSMPAYVLLGTDFLSGLRRKQGATGITTFDATQPMTNSQLTAMKLSVLTVCVFLAWMMMALGVLLWTATFGDFQTWVAAGERLLNIGSEVSSAWLFAIVLILLVHYVAAVTLLFAVGLALPLYQKYFAIGFILFAAHFILAMQSVKNGWSLGALWEFEAWGMALAILVVAVIVLRKTLKRGYLMKRHFAVALGFWIPYVVVVVALYLEFAQYIPTEITIPAFALALGTASLTTPLTAIGLAPLALAAHRHQ